MMKRNYLHIIQFVLTILLILPSCAQNDEIENGGEGVSGNKIALEFTLSEPESTLRATEPGDGNLNENRIKTIDVFIYQPGQDGCVFFQHIVPSPEITGTSTYSQLLNANQEFFSFNVNYSIYVVANYTGTIPTGGFSLTALKALSLSALNPDAKQDIFVMDGLINMVLNNGILVNKDVPVTLKRAASKIRLSMSYSNGFTPIAGSTITKKLVRYASNSSLIETGNVVTPSLQDMASFTNQNSGAGNSNNMVVYSYANDWNTTLANETYLIVNIPVKDASGTLYPLNYYKIPVNYRLQNDDNSSHTPEEEAARKSLYKLERNNIYDILAVIDKLGSTTPPAAVQPSANYTVQNWSTKEVLVSVENINFLYVKDRDIRMPNTNTFTTTFQSSTPDVQIINITVNGVASTNGSNGVTITWPTTMKSGNITISSTVPNTFAPKVIAFTVRNGANLTQTVTVNQYPSLYLSADISADAPEGGEGQDNKNMYIITSLIPNFSTLPNPDDFNEDFGSGYTHYAPNPTLGISYADYIRANAVLGYPLTDASGATIDTNENNRRISPRFMLASQYGVTTGAGYTVSRTKCIDYIERDATTGLTYSDWRMPTLAEIYMIDILQNVKLSQVKKILEGQYYWSARGTQAVTFMDPRVGNASNWGPYNAAVRCVRDVK